MDSFPNGTMSRVGGGGGALWFGRSQYDKHIKQKNSLPLRNRYPSVYKWLLLWNMRWLKFYIQPIYKNFIWDFFHNVELKLHILKDVVVLFCETFHPSIRPVIHHPSRHPSMARRRQSCGNWSHSVAHLHKAWPARSPQNLSNPPSNRLLQLHPYPFLQVTLTPYICIQDHCSKQQSKQEACWQQSNFNCFQLDSLIILGRGESCKHKRTMCTCIATTMPHV
jgi:hypothetical protein